MSCTSSPVAFCSMRVRRILRNPNRWTIRSSSGCTVCAASETGAGPTAAADFKQMVLDYIERRFGQSAIGRDAAE